MTWFRPSTLIFAAWAVVFGVFPRFANEFGGVGYVRSGHAEDWTRIVGLFSLAFAVLLNEAHRFASADLRRAVARGVLALLLLISYGMFRHADLPGLRRPVAGERRT